MHGTIEHYLGWKLATVIAGFIGGLVSLSFIKQLTPCQAIVSVLTGAVFAAYASPVIALYFTLNPRIEGLVAFLLGLTAMNLIPAILELSKKARDNIMRIVAFFQNGSK